MKAVALSQPHRKGSPSDWRTSAVGRLLEDESYLCEGLSRKALYEAANRFKAIYEKWQSVMSSSRPIATHTHSSGEITADLAERYKQGWLDALRALSNCDPLFQKAVMYTVIDYRSEDWAPPFWVRYGCIWGLVELANHFGLRVNGEDKDKRSPLDNARRI